MAQADCAFLMEGEVTLANKFSIAACVGFIALKGQNILRIFICKTLHIHKKCRSTDFLLRKLKSESIKISKVMIMIIHSM